MSKPPPGPLSLHPPGLDRQPPDPLEDICRQAGREARALMASGAQLCAPAVLGVLNRRLGGGLDGETVRRLTAALPEGMAAGCVCGALSGAQVALGRFLGEKGHSRAMAASARALHDGFRAAHGATCCRALTKKAPGRRGRKELCADLTGLAAELACRLILKARPELAARERPPAPAASSSWWRRLRQG